MGWSKSDIIAAFSAVIALGGFIVVIIQLSNGLEQYEKAQLTNRAQFLSQLHERGFGSDDMIAIFQKIEYNDFKCEGEFHKSEDQRSLFKLLSFFEFIGQLRDFQLISKEDVTKLFGYYIFRTNENDEVQKCLENLKNLAMNRGKLAEAITFPRFRDLAQDLNELN